MKTDILLEQEEHEAPMIKNFTPLRRNPHSAVEWAAERSVLSRSADASKYGNPKSKDQLRVPQTIHDVPQDVEEQEHVVSSPAVPHAIFKHYAYGSITRTYTCTCTIGST